MFIARLLLMGVIRVNSCRIISRILLSTSSMSCHHPWTVESTDATWEVNLKPWNSNDLPLNFVTLELVTVSVFNDWNSLTVTQLLTLVVWMQKICKKMGSSYFCLMILSSAWLFTTVNFTHFIWLFCIDHLSCIKDSSYCLSCVINSVHSYKK